MILTAEQVQMYLDRISQLEKELVGAGEALTTTRTTAHEWQKKFLERKDELTRAINRGDGYERSIDALHDQLNPDVGCGDGLIDDRIAKCVQQRDEARAELTTSRSETAAIVQLAADVAFRFKEQNRILVQGKYVTEEMDHVLSMAIDEAHAIGTAILALAKPPHRLALEERVAEAVESELDAIWSMWETSDQVGFTKSLSNRAGVARATLARIKREGEQAG